MAQVYEPVMHIHELSDDEVQYELSIRKIFVVTDNKKRRRQRLAFAINLEHAMVDMPVYQSPYDPNIDFETAQIIFNEINDLLNEEHIFSKIRGSM